jgi:hypothetical protein
LGVTHPDSFRDASGFPLYLFKNVIARTKHVAIVQIQSCTMLTVLLFLKRMPLQPLTRAAKVSKKRFKSLANSNKIFQKPFQFLKMADITP